MLSTCVTPTWGKGLHIISWSTCRQQHSSQCRYESQYGSHLLQVECVLCSSPGKRFYIAIIKNNHWVINDLIISVISTFLADMPKKPQPLLTGCRCRDYQWSRSYQHVGRSRQRGRVLPVSPPSKVLLVVQTLLQKSVSLFLLFSVSVLIVTSWWRAPPSSPCIPATYYWLWWEWLDRVREC